MHICYLNRTTRQVLKQVWFASQNKFGCTLFSEMTSYLGSKLNLSRRTIERSVALLLANNLITEVKKDGRIRRFAPTEFAISTKAKWDIGRDGEIKRKCYLRIPCDGNEPVSLPSNFVAENVAENVAETKATIYINSTKCIKSSSISPSTTKSKKRQKKEEDFSSEHERLKLKYGDEAYERALNYIASGKQVYNLELFLKAIKRNADLIKALPTQTHNQDQKLESQATITKGQERNIKANLEAFTDFASNHTGLKIKLLLDDLKIEIGNDTLYMYDEPKYITQTLEGLKTDRRIKQHSSNTYSAEVLMRQVKAKMRVV